MVTFYLQEGLRPLEPKIERNTHSNEPGVFLDDRLHKGNELINTLTAPSWLDARAQLSDSFLYR